MELDNLMFASSSMPQYVKIKYYLRSIIRNLPPDSIIPSENELSEKFGVSRGTVKQAVMDLVHEGILYRVVGKGTFTVKHVTRSYNILPSYTKDIENLGHIATSEIISFKKNAPAPRAKLFFNLNEDTGIIKYKRLVKDNDRPVAVVTSFLNPIIFHDLKESDLGNSVYQTLENKYHIQPAEAHDTYSVAEISKKTSELLECPANTIVIYSERQSYLNDGTPIEFVESFIRSDSFKLEIDYKSNNENITIPSVSVNLGAS